MRSITLSLFSTLLLLVLLAARPAPAHSPPDVVDIQVSPQTILLSWNAKGDVRVTVHAEIDYSSVATYTVQLGGYYAIYTKADARGDLVAKFNYEDILGLVNEGTTTLVLTGTRRDGSTFHGEDTVRVVG